MESRGRRARSQPGYYSGLLKGEKDTRYPMQMADAGKKMASKTVTEKSVKSKGKPKNSRSLVGSKASSKKSVRVEDEDDAETRMDRESIELGHELDALETKDGWSKHLHKKHMAGEIEFLEDMPPPEALEQDAICQEQSSMHVKEEEII